jgi:hypothetical protein
MAQVPPLTWNDRPDGAGLNTLIATVSTPQAAPVAAAARLRGGTATTGRSDAPAAGATGLIHVAARPARTAGTRSPGAYPATGPDKTPVEVVGYWPG